MADYTILIADYDPSTTELATQIFESAGFDVLVAKDGLKAVQIFKQELPVLTLIEFMMPKKAGAEVCRELRNSVQGKDSDLVMMISPFRGRSFRNDAVRVYGASDTIEKPLNREKIEQLIAERVRPKIQELKSANAEPAPAPTAPPPPKARPVAPPVAAKTDTPRPERARKRPVVPDTIAPPAAAAMETPPAPIPEVTHPVAAEPASLPPEFSQVVETAQALRDVVTAVLGAKGIATGAPAPQMHHPESNAERSTRTASASKPIPSPAPPKSPAPATDDPAEASEIEDRVDSLFDF